MFLWSLLLGGARVRTKNNPEFTNMDTKKLKVERKVFFQPGFLGSSRWVFQSAFDFRKMRIAFPPSSNTNCRFKGTSNSFKYRWYRVEQRYFSTTMLQPPIKQHERLVLEYSWLKVTLKMKDCNVARRQYNHSQHLPTNKNAPYDTNIPPWQLRWQRKLHHLKMQFLLKMWGFASNGHDSFQGGSSFFWFNLGIYNFSLNEPIWAGYKGYEILPSHIGD